MSDAFSLALITDARLDDQVAPVVGTLAKTFGNNGGDESRSSGPVTPTEKDDQSCAEEKSYLSCDQYFLSKQILMDEDELNLLRQILGKTSMVPMDDFPIDEDQHGSVRSIGVAINSDVADFGSEVLDNESFGIYELWKPSFVDQDPLSKLLQMGTVAEYQSEFEILINQVTGISENLLKSFYISGFKLDLQCAFLRSNPITLGEAFSLARVKEGRFTNLLWELLRSNPITLGEAFSLARITDACFEDQRSFSLSNKTSSNNGKLQNQNLAKSRFTMPRQEPIDEVVFVKVNDETKGFSLEEIIEEKNAFNLLQVVTRWLDWKLTSELERKGLVDGNQDDAKVVVWLMSKTVTSQTCWKGLNDKYLKMKKREVEIQRR
nr:protein kinase, catalytic domain-containing protein [Tanacetum cinerariifolium]